MLCFWQHFVHLNMHWCHSSRFSYKRIIICFWSTWFSLICAYRSSEYHSTPSPHGGRYISSNDDIGQYYDDDKKAKLLLMQIVSHLRTFWQFHLRGEILQMSFWIAVNIGWIDPRKWEAWQWQNYWGALHWNTAFEPWSREVNELAVWFLAMCHLVCFQIAILTESFITLGTFEWFCSSVG